MEITKEVLEKRLTELSHNRNQLLTAVRVHDGAIQDIEFWLSFLAKSPEPQKEI